MPCIPSYGITVYYIDFKKFEEMRLRTIKYNTWFWLNKMNPCQRINMKSSYGFNSGELLEKLHLLNTDFMQDVSDTDGWWNGMKELKFEITEEDKNYLKTILPKTNIML